MTESCNVAVLGAGIMGLALARNMLAAKLQVTVWNRTRERAELLLAAGGRVAGTAAEAARNADVLITMLSDGEAVMAAVTGEDGALSLLRPGALWLQMSTVGATWTDTLYRLAQDRQVEFVDAPVIGTRQPAEAGTLTVLASGDPRLSVRCEPVFSAIATRVLWVGEVGASSRLKLVANQWSIGLVALLSEVFRLARALRVSPSTFLQLIEGSPFDAGYAQTKGALMLAAEFVPSFPLDLAHKDVRLALTAAREAGCALPITSAIEEQYATAELRGWGRHDLSAVLYALEQPPLRRAPASVLEP